MFVVFKEALLSLQSVWLVTPQATIVVEPKPSPSKSAYWIWLSLQSELSKIPHATIVDEPKPSPSKSAYWIWLSLQSEELVTKPFGCEQLAI